VRKCLTRSQDKKVITRNRSPFRDDSPFPRPSLPHISSLRIQPENCHPQTRQIVNHQHCTVHNRSLTQGTLASIWAISNLLSANADPYKRQKLFPSSFGQTAHEQQQLVGSSSGNLFGTTFLHPAAFLDLGRWSVFCRTTIRFRFSPAPDTTTTQFLFPERSEEEEAICAACRALRIAIA
jgi:hypothetical protein